MLSQFIYFSRLIIVLRLILDKYAYSGKLKYIFICYFGGAIIGGRRLFEGGLLFE